MVVRSPIFIHCISKHCRKRQPSLKDQLNNEILVINGHCEMDLCEIKFRFLHISNSLLSMIAELSSLVCFSQALIFVLFSVCNDAISFVDIDISYFVFVCIFISANVISLGYHWFNVFESPSVVSSWVNHYYPTVAKNVITC